MSSLELFWTRAFTPCALGGILLSLVRCGSSRWKAHRQRLPSVQPSTVDIKRTISMVRLRVRVIVRLSQAE